MKNIMSSKDQPRWEAALLVLAMSSLAWGGTIRAQESGGSNSHDSVLYVSEPGTQTQTASRGSSVLTEVPLGTILPVVLRTSVSFEKCTPGQILHGKIAQDVPVPSGSKIRKGTAIEGHVVEVKRNTIGDGKRVTIQFDKLNVAGKWVPVVTNLRAIAGFMTVEAAQIPDEAPSEGSPYNWLPTTQIGGDSVYGVRGPVMSANDTSKVIGKSVGDGVLAQVSANEGAGCRGTLDSNDHLQALWVFSGDACGIYGIEHLKIAHAGRTNPRGTIVLVSETRKLSLRNGDGLLLRVD
jgi:hypothetical protein